ncbi:hypothetical protein QJQ45_028720 [Haematococcus lacustris]|nr:hypothetical protein QJQ45_028720 [Haematococcus lacustris]
MLLALRAAACKQCLARSAAACSTLASAGSQPSHEAAQISLSPDTPGTGEVLYNGWLHRHIKQKKGISYAAEVLEAQRKSYYAKLSFWEKVYYAAGALGACALIYTKSDWDGKKAAAAEAARVRAAALEERRLADLPAYLAGRSFADEADMNSLEGATPAEINALVAKLAASRSSTTGPGAAATRWSLPALSVEDDPFDGMTPEEIDAYMAKRAT